MIYIIGTVTLVFFTLGVSLFHSTQKDNSTAGAASGILLYLGLLLFYLAVTSNNILAGIGASVAGLFTGVGVAMLFRWMKGKG